LEWQPPHDTAIGHHPALIGNSPVGKTTNPCKGLGIANRRDECRIIRPAEGVVDLAKRPRACFDPVVLRPNLRDVDEWLRGYRLMRPRPEREGQIRHDLRRKVVSSSPENIGPKR
jgi:hypothetical protein